MSSVQTKGGKATSKREKRDCYSSFMYTQIHACLSVCNGFCFVVFWPSIILLIKWIFTNSIAYIYMLPINLHEWITAGQVNINESRWPGRKGSRPVISSPQSPHIFSNRLIGPQHIARMYWLLPTILYEIIIVLSLGPRLMTTKAFYLGCSFSQRSWYP